MKRFANHKYGIRLFYLMLFIVLIVENSNTSSARAQDPPLTIGVLAIRGTQQCLTTWAPTAEYLTRQVTGRRFIIVPLPHNLIYPRVQKGEVDFILANSAFYVGLEQWYQANRIVTLKEKRLNGVYTRYGGVIFAAAIEQTSVH
jgi:two-component system sensor histidine kinase/response regulator